MTRQEYFNYLLQKLPDNTAREISEKDMRDALNELAAVSYNKADDVLLGQDDLQSLVLPNGGLVNQVLKKQSGDDFDTAFGDVEWGEIKGSIANQDDLAALVSVENTGGSVLYVNPLNANASDSYTRTQALGRPEKSFLTANGAIGAANAGDIICIANGASVDGFTLPSTKSLTVIGDIATVTGAISINFNNGITHRIFFASQLTVNAGVTIGGVVSSASNRFLFLENITINNAGGVGISLNSNNARAIALYRNMTINSAIGFSVAGGNYGSNSLERSKINASDSGISGEIVAFTRFLDCEIVATNIALNQPGGQDDVYKLFKNTKIIGSRCLYSYGQGAAFQGLLFDGCELRSTTEDAVTLRPVGALSSHPVVFHNSKISTPSSKFAFNNLFNSCNTEFRYCTVKEGYRTGTGVNTAQFSQELLGANFKYTI